MKNDNLNKKCKECKKGTYVETSIYDDLDGVLHCSKCNSKVKRSPENNVSKDRSMKNNKCELFQYSDTYYPRLQVNGRGEIVLATSKVGTLTRGMLVGYTDEAKGHKYPLGSVFSDWEVCGPLKDYDGEVTITISDKKKY